MGMTVRYEVPTTRIYRKMDVILNKVNGELYSLDGIPDPVAVVSVIASGFELNYILRKFEGLPYAKDVDEMTWRGDFARFIMDHLKIVRYPK
jgi:hypothetical protein